MPENAKIETLYDYTTGEPVAPRTVVQAISGEGKKWNYVGFTEDNVLGVIDGTWPCNPNLLDNWYFVGSGQFPINQRGQTVYYSTESKYCVDRWKINDGGQGKLSVTVDNTGLILSADQDWMRLEQPIDHPIRLKDHILIFSVLVNNPDSGVNTTIINNTKMVYYNAKLPAQNGVGLCSVTINSNLLKIEESDSVSVNFYPNQGTTLIAAKLELGTQQTLAHKENGVWVLNEMPDYATELAKCQRYYQVFKNEELRPVEAEDFRPVMRIKPTMGTVSINDVTYYTADANL